MSSLNNSQVEEILVIKSPFFNGTYFNYWKTRIETIS